MRPWSRPLPVGSKETSFLAPSGGGEYLGPMLVYDQPLYRPPSEGNSLIIQATLGCSFNECSFCSMYKEKTFRARPRQDVFADIETAARDRPDARRVFLADGDALVLPVDDLKAILDRLGDALPNLQRVSCYATPLTLRQKKQDELSSLKGRGLSLVYVGLESGSNPILKRITKGATRDTMVLSLERARAAHMKVSATVILGLGGKNHWRDHMEGTAELINRAPPRFLSTLQLYLDRSVAGRFMKRFGEPFEPQDDAGILVEQEHLIAALDPPSPVIFRSNHASNCLALAGNLPKDRGRLLAEIGRARTGATVLRPASLRGL